MLLLSLSLIKAGYQITQKRVPLAVGGSLLVPIQSSDENLNVRFQQIQLEQDSGKIVFGESLGEHGKEILVDFNRAGKSVPTFYRGQA